MSWTGEDLFKSVLLGGSSGGSGSTGGGSGIPQADIDAAFAALAEKGVIVPDGATSADLDDLIASIEAGEYHGGDVVHGEFTLAADNISYGVEIEKPSGWENGTVPTVACLYNKTYTDVKTNTSQIQCRTLVMVAFNGGIGIRYSQNETNTGGGVFDDPSGLCKWYGNKLWFYGSDNINYKSLRAGDTYGWFYIL